MDPISNDLQHVVVVGLSHDSMYAYVVSLVIEALLLGTFTVTYTMGAYWLLKSLAFRTRRKRDWVLLGTSTAMFGLAFAHLALSLKLTFAIFPTLARSDGSCDSVPLLEATTVFPLWIFQKVAEAIVQSAAIYSTASIALALTFFLNPHNKPGFLVCLDVFPPLIGLVFSFIILRMARSSAEDASRLSSHTANCTDKPRSVIRPRSRPLSVRLHIPPFPPPALQLATFDIREDIQETGSSNESTNSFKPAKLKLQNSELAEDRDLEGPPREDDLGVLDIRGSKSSWNM
ncbi:hypothetical protein VTO73DRAFT_11951 [Trametes versicolor]